MSAWEAIGQSDEWYTPAYVFEALGEDFDLDVAAPTLGAPHVPAQCFLSPDLDGLRQQWRGFVWMNPPFGGRNGLVPWLNRFFDHGNGVALTPDRTSAPWWQAAAHRASGLLLVDGKIKFERPDGSLGKSPGTGTTLFAAGPRARAALYRAQSSGLGIMMDRISNG